MSTATSCKAIEDSRATLSVTRCYFKYQFLLLLGQKVSWLGLFTHKKKVDAILLIDEPKDHHDLQVFLGMMVYFSVHIPFYAWITGPLFNLLKGNVKWEWTEVHSKAFKLCKCYIPEFGTLLLIFLLIYGYDFILYHMITYLYSRT